MIGMSFPQTKGEDDNDELEWTHDDQRRPSSTRSAVRRQESCKDHASKKGEQGDVLVRTIDLSNMRIVRVPSTAWHSPAFKALRELDLSRNELSQIPVVSGLVNLRTLRLYYNKIRGWTDIESLKYNRKLTNLDLRLNPCTVHPDYTKFVLHWLPQLQMLDGVDVNIIHRTGEILPSDVFDTWGMDELKDNQTHQETLEEMNESYQETDVKGRATYFGVSSHRCNWCSVRVVKRKEPKFGRLDSADSSYNTLCKRNKRRTSSVGALFKMYQGSCQESKEGMQDDGGDIREKVRAFKNIRDEIQGLLFFQHTHNNSKVESKDLFPCYVSTQHTDLMEPTTSDIRTVWGDATHSRYYTDGSARGTLYLQSSPSFHGNNVVEDPKGLIKEWPFHDQATQTFRQNSLEDLTFQSRCVHTGIRDKTCVIRSLSRHGVNGQAISPSCIKLARSHAVLTEVVYPEEPAGKDAATETVTDEERIWHQGANSVHVYDSLNYLKHRQNLPHGDTVVVPSRPLQKQKGKFGFESEQKCSEQHRESSPKDDIQYLLGRDRQTEREDINWKDKYEKDQELWRHNFTVLKYHYEKAVKKLLDMKAGGNSTQSSSNYTGSTNSDTN